MNNPIRTLIKGLALAGIVAVVASGCQPKETSSEVQILQKDYAVPASLTERIKGADSSMVTDTFMYKGAIAKVTAKLLKKDSIALIASVTISKVEKDGVEVLGQLNGEPINRNTKENPRAYITGTVFFNAKSIGSQQSRGRTFAIDALGKLYKDDLGEK